MLEIQTAPATAPRVSGSGGISIIKGVNKKIAKFLKNAAQKQQNINDILAEYFPSLDNNI